MQGIAFTGFGLGDSNYTRYQYVPRAVRQRLLDLGAAEVGTQLSCTLLCWMSFGQNQLASACSRRAPAPAGPGGRRGGWHVCCSELLGLYCNGVLRTARVQVAVRQRLLDLGAAEVGGMCVIVSYLGYTAGLSLHSTRASRSAPAPVGLGGRRGGCRAVMYSLVLDVRWRFSLLQHAVAVRQRLLDLGAAEVGGTCDVLGVCVLLCCLGWSVWSLCSL